MALKPRSHEARPRAEHILDRSPSTNSQDVPRTRTFYRTAFLEGTRRVPVGRITMTKWRVVLVDVGETGARKVHGEEFVDYTWRGYQTN